MNQQIQLTGGSCRSLQTASPEDTEVLEREHIVQLLSLKKVGNADPTKINGPERYRIIISDGLDYMQAMLATQLNSLVHENTIQRNTVVALEKLTCNYVQEKRYALRRPFYRAMIDASIHA